jgi:hypothetical protein
MPLKHSICVPGAQSAPIETAASRQELGRSVKFWEGPDGLDRLAGKSATGKPGALFT